MTSLRFLKRLTITRVDASRAENITTSNQYYKVAAEVRIPSYVSSMTNTNIDKQNRPPVGEFILRWMQDLMQMTRCLAGEDVFDGVRLIDIFRCPS
jgi:hypothetical protein